MRLALFHGCTVMAAMALVPILVAHAFEITPPVQAELDRQRQVIAGWAAHSTIVNAVKEQNAKGPISGMDNQKWKTTRRTDPIVTAMQASAAGRFLTAKLEASGGIFSEAFLNAKGGEKVAFAEKTTSYLHVGQAKHDVPFGTAKPWQGKPEFDESSQTYAVQISVPVLDGGKPIGSLVVGVNVSHLERIAKQ